MSGVRTQRRRRGLLPWHRARDRLSRRPSRPPATMSSPKTGPPGNPFYALDTKNLFGFLEGADVGEKGDRSLEFETTGSFGGAQGVYNSIEQEFIFENTLTDSLGLELGAHVLGQDIRHAPDLPDFAGVNFSGVSAELRYVVLHRTTDLPIQLTLTLEPEYSVIADAGLAANDFTTAFRAIADVISSDRRLYGAINLVYEPDGSRFPGQPWQDTALLSASAALSYRPTPALMFGAEADYDRAYGGLVPRGFEGQAFYLGRPSTIRSTTRSISRPPSSPKRPWAVSTSTNSRASSPS